MAEASEEELVLVDDVGEITAKAICTYFSSEQNREILRRLKEEGVNTLLKEDGAAQAETQKFAGAHFRHHWNSAYDGPEGRGGSGGAAGR